MPTSPHGAATGRPFTPGESHPRYAGGCILNEKGYVRVTTGRMNMKYEHRLVIERLMLEQAVMQAVAGSLRTDPNWGALTAWEIAGMAADKVREILDAPPSIPPTMHVHHINGNRTHNCPCNLMLLDKAIHSALTTANRRMRKQREMEGMMGRLRDAGHVEE